MNLAMPDCASNPSAPRNFSKRWPTACKLNSEYMFTIYIPKYLVVHRQIIPKKMVS